MVEDEHQRGTPDPPGPPGILQLAAASLWALHELDQVCDDGNMASCDGCNAALMLLLVYLY